MCVCVCVCACVFPGGHALHFPGRKSASVRDRGERAGRRGSKRPPALSGMSFSSEFSLPLLLFVSLCLIAGDDSKKPSPVFTRLSSFTDKAGWGLGLDLWRA